MRQIPLPFVTIPTILNTYLKIFPIKSAIFFILVSFLLTSCVPVHKETSTSLPIPQQDKAQVVQLPQKIQQEFSYSNITPPWKIWAFGANRDEALLRAEEFEKRGELQRAIEEYKIVERTAVIPQVKDDAFLYRLNVALKMGNSAQVLAELSAYIKERSITENNLSPQLTLIAVYAYYYQRNYDQALAWLNLLSKKVERLGSNSSLNASTQNTGRIILSTVEIEKFLELRNRWGRLSFYIPLFKEEEHYRKKNPKAHPPKIEWANPITYRASEPTPTVYDDPQNFYSDKKPFILPDNVITAVLPLSGRLAPYGKVAQNGINLALEQYFGNSATLPKVHYIDSAVYDVNLTREVVTTDEYGNEVKIEEAVERDPLLIPRQTRIIIGPLDVKATELLGDEVMLGETPFISLAKKENITEISDNCFRLGVTASNQIAELVSYATINLGYKSFSVFYPENETGRELAGLFQNFIGTMGGQIVHSGSYKQKNLTSMRQAFSSASRDLGEAVFIADALDDTKSLITNIKRLHPDIVFLGTALWDDKAVISSLSVELDGSVFVTPFYRWSEQRNIRDFITSYNMRFGSDPDILAAQTFDATLLMLNIFGNDPSSIQNFGLALKRAKMLRGITGVLKVYPNKEINRRMTILKIQGGVPIEVMVGGRMVQPSKVPINTMTYD